MKRRECLMILYDFDFASILEIEAATSNHFIAMIRRVPSLLTYLILGTVKDP